MSRPQGSGRVKEAKLEFFARSRVIKHPLGVALRTPCLIPSFSSKVYLGPEKKRPRTPKAPKQPKPKHEIATILAVASEFITDALLISAYDLHYGYIPSVMDFQQRPELIVIDSGGYEAATDHDFATTLHFPYKGRPWSEARCQRVYSEWSQEQAAIFVSYDHPKQQANLREQLAAARRLQRWSKKQMFEFLVKPESRSDSYLDAVLGKVFNAPELLSGFDVIGVTEKELGRSFVERAGNLIMLRRALEQATITAPIHVFGALDPLACALYFLAGAELFDGLNWMRYAFLDDAAVYSRQATLMRGTPDDDDSAAQRIRPTVTI